MLSEDFNYQPLPHAANNMFEESQRKRPPILHSGCSDQAWQTPRLFRVFAGFHNHFVASIVHQDN